MQLHDALLQITEIRSQIARTETFRGYRSVTVGFSGVLGIAAAIFQAVQIPEPRQQVSVYLTLWISAAALSVLVVGWELAFRCYHAVSPRTTRLTLLAVEQFVPSIVAGALRDGGVDVGGRGAVRGAVVVAPRVVGGPV